MTEREIRKNNFADVARWLSLDIHKFATVDEEVKLDVYDAFAFYRVETLTASKAQEKLDFALRDAWSPPIK